MKKLFIQYPLTFINEKRYISHVIFDCFLGIENEVSFVDGISYVKISTDQDFNENVLILSDTFFQTPESKWLKKSSLPLSPLESFDLTSIAPKERFYAPDLPILFKGTPPDDLTESARYFNVDLIGGMFFCLTLYEEYTLNAFDAYGRFDYSKSMFFKQGLYERALVNEYLEVLWFLLESMDPELKRKERNYRLYLTHDVDHPLSSYSNSWVFVKACVGDLVSRKSAKVMAKRIMSKFYSNDRLDTIDPNNSFNFIMGVSEQYGIKSEFYFIVTKGDNTIDGNYEINSPFYKKMLSLINSRDHLVGFHPSFFTYCDFDRTQQEFSKLKKICDEIGIKQDRWGGRQHFLRWKNPDTWRIWEKMGANFDSSIGWSTITGFRAGTCYEYPVYDLQERRMLNLIERPLIVMDVAYASFSTYDEFMAHTAKLAGICKHFNGNMVLLFHNNYLISDLQKHNYKKIVKEIIP